MSSLHRRVLALSLLAGLFCMPLRAHAQVLYLKDLEQSAAQNRPLSDMNRARIAQGDAQLGRARSGYLPTVTAGVNASLSPGRELVSTPVDVKHPQDKVLVSGSRTLDDSRAYGPQGRYGLTVGLRGNLYDFGRTAATVEAARAQRSAAEADAHAAERRLLRDVRGAYVRWAAAHALAKLAQEAALGAEMHEKRTLGLIEEGMRPKVDGTTAAQETAVARLEAAHADDELSTARLDLAYVAARDIPVAAEPDPALLSGSQGLPPDQPRGADDLAALERARSAALSRARVQERSIAPVLTYDATTGLQGQSANLFPVYSVGVGISAVLWDGGASSAGADEARADAAELAAQAAEQQALTDHEKARIKTAQEHAERTLQLAAASLQLAEAQVAQLAEDAGVDSATYALQAGAEAARLRARREVLLAQAALVQARFGLLAR